MLKPVLCAAVLAAVVAFPAIAQHLRKATLLRPDLPLPARSPSVTVVEAAGADIRKADIQTKTVPAGAGAGGTRGGAMATMGRARA